jgi:hypothetical protein
MSHKIGRTPLSHRKYRQCRQHSQQPRYQSNSYYVGLRLRDDPLVAFGIVVKFLLTNADIPTPADFVSALLRIYGVPPYMTQGRLILLESQIPSKNTASQIQASGTTSETL